MPYEIVSCPGCERETYANQPKCPKCGFVLKPPIDYIAKARETGDFMSVPEEVLADFVMSTTEDTANDWCILRRLGVVVADEYVWGIPPRDKRRKAMRSVLHRLRAETAMIDANAVIGIRTQYAIVPRGSTEDLLLTASGTAVRLEIIDLPHARISDQNPNPGQ